VPIVSDFADRDANTGKIPGYTANDSHVSGLSAVQNLILARRPLIRHVALGGFVAAALTLGFFATTSHSAITDTDSPDVATSLAGLGVTEMVAPEYVSKSVSLGKGGTLSRLLTDNGVSRANANQAIVAVSKIYDVRRIRVGTDVQLNFEKTIDPSHPLRLDKMEIVAAVDRKVVAQRANDGNFAADNVFADLSVATVRAGGTISNSLYASARQVGLPDAIIVDAIRIFSYDVDFQREVRNGDHFEVLFERYHDEQGQPVKEGNILYASLTVSGKELDLYRHAPSDSKRTEYFADNGQTARKALMRTPIDGARLTSGYGKRRHPILGYRKMHKGLDFGARRGTPIMAAGDGRIEKLGRNGGYGKYIRIRHNSTYSTAYAHMNGYRKGLRSGKRVKQGDIIGYVGSTGRSTGPHLHYEVLKNGRQTNPLKVKMPTGRKLKGKLLAEFKATVAKTRVRLAEAPLQALIASAE
jgi:murein DD-endopeptidase MepM/ murein hydrolase activator NlpD